MNRMNSSDKLTTLIVAVALVVILVLFSTGVIDDTVASIFGAIIGLAALVLYVNSPEPPTVVSSTFPLDDNGKVPFALYVPYGSFSSYRNASYWNAFSDMREAGSKQQNTGTGSRPTAGTASTSVTSDNRVNTAPAGNYSPNDYYDADDEINDLQRQIIELQQLNARLKDAIYKALFSSNLDECHRLLKEAVSKE